jgi:hypothetical protein
MAKRRKSKQSNDIVKYSVIGVAVLAALMLIINFAPTGQFLEADSEDLTAGSKKIDATCVWTPSKNTWNSETELCSNPAYENEASCLNPLWQKNTWVENEWVPLGPGKNYKCEGTASDGDSTEFCGMCKQLDPKTGYMDVLSIMMQFDDVNCESQLPRTFDLCYTQKGCESPNTRGSNQYYGGICINAAKDDNVWTGIEGQSLLRQVDCESSYSCLDSSVNKHSNFRSELPADAKEACAEAAGSCSDGISTTEASCLAATCVAVDPIIPDPIIPDPIPADPIPADPIIEEPIPASFDLLTYQSGVCNTNIDAGDETGSAMLIIEILADAKVSHYQYVEITELSDWSANNDGAFPATLSGIGDLSGTTCKIMLWRDWSGEPIINAIESSYISDI